MPRSGIHKAEIEELKHIRDIAYETWPTAYQNVVSQEQVDFMLDKGYSLEALERLIENEGQLFLIFWKNDVPLGFVSFREKKDDPGILRIEKLYILPAAQRKGIGSALLKVAEEFGKEKSYRFLELNVNRKNPSVEFYQKMGFFIHEALDIPYYQFWLNDYIMLKAIA